MNITDRTAKYLEIENFRGRPLVVYATSTRANYGGIMASDAVREFIDQIEAIPAAEKSIDVLIHSSGGDALTAWKLMATLRERFDTVAVLVPSTAFSAATVFALGANEIVLHPYASLGPIDPQITAKMQNGEQRQFAYEDLGAFLRFLNSDFSLSEQAHIAAIADKLFETVDPLTVGGAKRASELSEEVGARLLSGHINDLESARQIAANLNKSFFAHGDAVTRTRALELDLPVSDPDQELEKLIWEAYLGIEDYMELRKPFEALQLFLDDSNAAASIAPRQPLALPPDTPEPIAQQTWQHVINQAIQDSQGNGPEVAFSVINAVIESPRFASEFKTEGWISATRLPNGEIKVSLTPKRSLWSIVELPESE